MPTCLCLAHAVMQIKQETIGEAVLRTKNGRQAPLCMRTAHLHAYSCIGIEYLHVR